MLVTKRFTVGVVVAAGWVGVFLPGTPVRASTIPFDAATETYAQTQASPFPWSAALAIDGSTNGNYTGLANGWAIADQNTPDPTNPESAYFRFTNAVNLTPGEKLQISLYQLFNYNNDPYYLFHTLGAFRLSVTGDDLSATMDAAHALANTVASSWTALVPPNITVKSAPPLPPPPPGYVINGSGDILVNNPGLASAIYTISAKPGISHITGIRLDVLAAPVVLPTDGPGFQPTNGNFVLNEITAAVPLPAAAGVGFSMLGGIGGLVALRKRLRGKPRIA